jgi:hypothetical protein
MTLKVCVANEPESSAEVLRVLIDKAAGLVGVLAAVEQPAASDRSQVTPAGGLCAPRSSWAGLDR